MKKNISLISVLLCLIMLFSLLSVSAFADNSKAAAEEASAAEAAEEESDAPVQEKTAAENEKTPDKKLSPDEKESKPERVIVPEGESLYAEPGTVVFNNGGTVYNNDAVVYNNGGVVYNNLGIVYNNGGTVYANGGTVYNNSGTVYNNDAEVISNQDAASAEDTEEDVPAEDNKKAEDPAPAEDDKKSEDPAPAEDNKKTEDAAPADDDKKSEDAAPDEEDKKSDDPAPDEEDKKASAEESVPEAEVKDGFYKVELAADYSDYIEFEDLDEEGQLYVAKSEAFSFKLRPGYALSSYKLSSGEFRDNKNGSYTVSNINQDAELEMEFGIAAPLMSLESGTYFEEQTLEITSCEDAVIYYTTDGSDPSEKSRKYSKPLELEEGSVVKAFAVSEEFGESEISSVEIAIAEIDVPRFKDVKRGYGDIKPVDIEIENEGSVDAVIEKMTLSGKHSNFFKLSESAGETLTAGESEKGHWTLNPLSNLEPGEYTVTLIAESGSGQTAEFEISFKVK